MVHLFTTRVQGYLVSGTMNEGTLKMKIAQNVSFKRLRQAKHRNIAVMAMEAEKVEESSKRLELSVSISQDALEVDDVHEDGDSSWNIDCSRQVPPLIFPDFQSARFPPNFD